MPKNNQPATPEMQELARQLKKAYKKLQQTIDNKNTGLLNPNLDKMFLTDPKLAIETFNAMLKSTKEYYNTNKGQLGKTGKLVAIKTLSKDLKEIKAEVKKLSPTSFGQETYKPMEQMLAFIEQLFAMFAKLMSQMQEIKAKPNEKLK